MRANAMPCHAIIPCRYASTRLPGKPLADIGGRPLMWHVYEKVRQSSLFDSVHIATDDARIESVAKELNLSCILTGEHNSGTDRVNEVANILCLPSDCVVVNIQGDEPFITKSMLERLISPFSHANTEVATLGFILDPKNEKRILSPNQVKIVLSKDGYALYFSRLPIPFARDGAAKTPHIGHIGLYAFRRDILAHMALLPPSVLEETEKLEQLRLLENGIRICVSLVEEETLGVDTIEDLVDARLYFLQNERFIL